MRSGKQREEGIKCFKNIQHTLCNKQDKQDLPNLRVIDSEAMACQVLHAQVEMREEVQTFLMRLPSILLARKQLPSGDEMHRHGIKM